MSAGVCKLSYRDLEEMAAERGVDLDHSAIYRWVIKFRPEIEKVVRRNKCAALKSWRLDETLVWDSKLFALQIRCKWRIKLERELVEKQGACVQVLLELIYLHHAI